LYAARRDLRVSDADTAAAMSVVYGSRMRRPPGKATSTVAVGIGPGWCRLVERLDAELTALDAAATTRTGINEAGLLTVRIQSEVLDRAVRRVLERCCEADAAETCETCGDPGQVRGGPIVQIACESCVVS
jgi:hypothetical protein